VVGDGGFVPFDGALPADAAPIAIGDLCPLFTSDLCTYLMQCAHAGYKDTTQCLGENTCYGYTQLKEAAEAGAVLYDPEKVGACDEAFRNNPCGFGASFLFTPDIFEVLGVCTGALTPKLTTGQSCLSSGECQSGFCQKQGATCPGVCADFAIAGQPCSNGAFVPDAGSGQCGKNLICNSKNVCQPYGSVGSSCATDGDCGPTINNQHLWCDTSTGKCAAGVDAGAPCGVGRYTCAPGLWCRPFVDAGTDFLFYNGPGSCVALGAAGSPCDVYEGCQQGLHCVYPTSTLAPLGQCSPPSSVGSPCSIGSDCATGLACIDGDGGGSVCATPSGVGGPCNGATGPTQACTSSAATACTSGTTAQCATGLACSGTKCLNPRYAGDLCDATSICVFGTCVRGTCVNLGNVGAGCTNDSDCSTNACIGGKCADTSVCSNPGDGG
jgi:hypothetical protein